VPVAPTNNDAAVGLDPARVVDKLHDGGAVGGEAEELGGDFGLLFFAVVRAEGLSKVVSVSFVSAGS
jgi:hypothetical protein